MVNKGLAIALSLVFGCVGLFFTLLIVASCMRRRSPVEVIRTGFRRMMAKMRGGNHGGTEVDATTAGHVMPGGTDGTELPTRGIAAPVSSPTAGGTAATEGSPSAGSNVTTRVNTPVNGHKRGESKASEATSVPTRTNSPYIINSIPHT